MVDVMFILLLLLIVGGIIYFFWNVVCLVVECVVELGCNVCCVVDVQWLDQVVYVIGLWLLCGEDGWFGFECIFKFEYFYDGIDCYVGCMVLCGDQLILFIGFGVVWISQIWLDVEDVEDVQGLKMC